MKMRWDRQCPACPLTVYAGTRAVRLHGGYWHPECVEKYRQHRAESGYSSTLKFGSRSGTGRQTLSGVR